MILTFSLQSIAAKVPSNNSIANVMTKYDYLLTAHPQAHEEEFAKQNLEAMKKEMKSLTSKMSKDQLNIELETILKKVPTSEQRVAFQKLLETSTPEQVAAFFTSPKLLQAALRGEGANFAMNWEENGAMYVLGALFLSLIVVAIIEAIKYSKYEWFYASNGLECRLLSSAEQNDILRRALRKCRDGATHPETCERYSFGDDTDSWEDSNGNTYEDTDCEAAYRAKKKLD